MADYKYSQGLGAMSQQDVNNLITAAGDQYKFLKNNDFAATYTGPKGRDGDYLEAWQKGDRGDPSWPRDPRLPVSRAGLEIFRPDTSATDIAADVYSHMDQNGKNYGSQLFNSLSPSQIAQMKKESGDYDQTLRMGLGEKAAIQNASSSLNRAAVFNQWGGNELANMGLNVGQQNIIDHAKGYANSGVVPSKDLYDIRAALRMSPTR
jgi:hypothetical protein